MSLLHACRYVARVAKWRRKSGTKSHARAVLQERGYNWLWHRITGVVLSVLIFPSPIWMGLPWKNCEQFSDQAKSYIVDQKDYKWNYCIWIGKDSMAEFFVMSLLCFKYITQFHHYFCMLFEIFYNNHLVVPYSIDMTLSLSINLDYILAPTHTPSHAKKKNTDKDYH